MQRRLLAIGALVCAGLSLPLASSPAKAAGVKGPAQVCNTIRNQESQTGVTVITPVIYGFFDFNGNVAKECGARPMRGFMSDANYWPGTFDVKWGNFTAHKASGGLGTSTTGLMYPGFLTNFDYAVPFSIKWRDFCPACHPDDTPSTLGGVYAWAGAVQWKRIVGPLINHVPGDSVAPGDDAPPPSDPESPPSEPSGGDDGGGSGADSGTPPVAGGAA